MGSRYFHPEARRARPIINTRDYDAARKGLKKALKAPVELREDDRIEGLRQELRAFEDRFLMREQWLAIEWAECVFVPDIELDEAHRRRWNDRDLPS